MVGLIVHRLKQSNPELIPTDASTVHASGHANVPAEYKRDILESVLRAAGPETLLSIGQGIRGVAYDPIWHVALRAASPTVLFDKWRRFEVFAHSRNRLRIEPAGEKRALFHRYTVDGGTPTTAENLLICGVMIGLLEEIGCLGLRCDMPLHDGTAYGIRQNGRFSVPGETNALMATTWTIEWQTFFSRLQTAASGLESPVVALPRSCDATLRIAVETIARLLMQDVERQWKVGELARELDLSPRSLQRTLGDAELSFSRLVRLVRIHEACRLLADTGAPITSIGFCAGFSDSSHFSRDFRASIGLTPSDYRGLFSRADGSLRPAQSRAVVNRSHNSGRMPAARSARKP